MRTVEPAIVRRVGPRWTKNKAGVPYGSYPLRMMLKMTTREMQMAAVLRDVVED